MRSHITASEARATHDPSLAAAAAAELGDLAQLPPGRFYHFKVAGDLVHRHGWAIRTADHVTLGSFKGTEHEIVRLDAQPKAQADTRRLRKAMHVEAQAKLARQEQAAARASALWNASVDLDDDFPYLQRKRVWSNGARLRRNPWVPTGSQLVVPLYDRTADGKLWTLELIDVDGVKKFLPGGLTAGCFFTIAESWMDADRWLVCEGYATGCALAMATGLPVACAMSCGNLVATARQVRAEHPHSPIILCGDNDTKTDGNPGLTHARQAAAAVGSKVVLPRAPFNDFDDQWVATGEIRL